MQARKAVILPLGVLLKRVDTHEFTEDMVAQARYENNNFVLNQAIKMQALTLCEQYNQGALKSDEFKTKLYNVLSIKQLEEDKFWRMWNDIVNPENIIDKIKLLQQTAEHHQSLFYIISDTNPAHVEYIAAACKKQDVMMLTDSNPAKLAEMPLYTSCQQRKSRHDLIKLVVDAIKKQQNITLDEIILVSSDPAMIDDAEQRKYAQAERKTVFAWCDENKIKVQNHRDNFRETLLSIYEAEISASLQLLNNRLVK